MKRFFKSLAATRQLDKESKSNIAKSLNNTMKDPRDTSSDLTEKVATLRSLLDSQEISKAQDFEAELGENGNAELMTQRARLALVLGDALNACQLARSALSMVPENGETNAYLAASLMQLGEARPALEAAERGIRAGFDAAWLRVLAGVIHASEGRSTRAVEEFEAALTLDPGHLDALRNVTVVCFRLHRWTDVERHSRRLAISSPDSAFAWSVLALSLVMLAREDEAWTYFRKSLQQADADVETHRNYATGLLNVGKVEEALEQIEEGLKQAPDEPTLRVARSACLLLRRETAPSVWNDYEYRLQLDPSYFRVATKRWQGQRLDVSQPLLLYSEQGLGDVILAGRYIKDVIQKAPALVVQVPHSLFRLFQQTATANEWTGVRIVGGPRPSQGDAFHTFELPLMSLLSIADAFPATADGSYLSVDETLVEEWRDYLGTPTSRKRRVGLIWAGNPVRFDDSIRSVPTQALQELRGARDVEFVCLQMDAKPEYRSHPMPLDVIDPTPQIKDFADTAAIMRCLDLVISIDTSAAHLAGALGVNCWVLLSLIPDWRWQIAASAQPWYSTVTSMKVARQCGWRDLLVRVRKRLDEPT